MLDRIFDLLTTAIDDCADDKICGHLAAAWCAAHADEHGYVDGYVDDAHRAYVTTYYGLADDADNPREVSVPEWAPAYAPLLRRLARRERHHDDAVLRTYQRDAAAKVTP